MALSSGATCESVYVPDPESLTAAAAGSAVGAAYVAKTLGRVLGPATDEIAEALRRWTAWRVRNTRRVAAAAETVDRRVGAREGAVNPRVAAALLEVASWSEDELMAQYLGGALVSAKTDEKWDDR